MLLNLRLTGRVRGAPILRLLAPIRRRLARLRLAVQLGRIHWRFAWSWLVVEAAETKRETFPLQAPSAVSSFCVEGLLEELDDSLGSMYHSHWRLVVLTRLSSVGHELLGWRRQVDAGGQKPALEHERRRARCLAGDVVRVAASHASTRKIELAFCSGTSRPQTCDNPKEKG